MAIGWGGGKVKGEGRKVQDSSGEVVMDDLILMMMIMSERRRICVTYFYCIHTYAFVHSRSCLVSRARSLGPLAWGLLDFISYHFISYRFLDKLHSVWKDLSVCNSNVD